MKACSQRLGLADRDLHWMVMDRGIWPTGTWSGNSCSRSSWYLMNRDPLVCISMRPLVLLSTQRSDEQICSGINWGPVIWNRSGPRCQLHGRVMGYGHGYKESIPPEIAPTRMFRMCTYIPLSAASHRRLWWPILWSSPGGRYLVAWKGEQ